MATYPMVNPQTGDRYEIPSNVVEQAQKDGLVLAAKMKKGDDIYFIPQSEIESAKAQGLTLVEKKIFSDVPTPGKVGDERQARTEEVNKRRAQMGGLYGLGEDISGGVRRTFLSGGPTDIRNIVNAVGPPLAAAHMAFPGKQAITAAGNVGAKVKSLTGPEVGSKIAAQLLRRGREGVQMGGRAGVAAAKAAQNQASSHPIRSLLAATALNHFLGDPLRVKQFLRSLVRD